MCLRIRIEFDYVRCSLHVSVSFHLTDSGEAPKPITGVTDDVSRGELRKVVIRAISQVQFRYLRK